MWVEGVIRSLMFKTVIQDYVDRSWDFVGHGDVYHKARLPNIESQTKSASTALDPYVYTDTEQTITINAHQACAIKHEDIATLLSRNNVKEEMKKNMGYSLARAIDVALAALAASFSQIVGTLGVETTYDNYLRAAQYLEDAGYSLSSDCAWLISVPTKYSMMKMDDFRHADYVGTDEAKAAHKEARIGKFIGAPVVVSNLITAPAAGQHENFLLHRETLALIMAQQPKVSVDRIALDLADVIVMDQVYGKAEVDRYSEAAGNITATDEGSVLIRGV